MYFTIINNLKLLIMTKLKSSKLQALATELANQQVGSKQLCDLKGGCSSCEDTRRPPRFGNNNDSGNNQQGRNGNW
jgi:hypothetical protein